MKLLLVGSRLLYSQAFQQYLELTEEWAVVTCSSGQASLEVAGNYVPDVFMIDAHLPDMDNIMLLKEIKRQTDGVYIVLILNRDDHRRLEQALKIGIDDFVLTPFEDIDLITRLRKALFIKDKDGSTGSKERETGSQPAAAYNSCEKQQNSYKTAAVQGSSAPSSERQDVCFLGKGGVDFASKEGASLAGGDDSKAVLVNFPSSSPKSRQESVLLEREKEVVETKTSEGKAESADSLTDKEYNIEQTIETPEESNDNEILADTINENERKEVASYSGDGSFTPGRSSSARRSGKKKSGQSPLSFAARIAGNAFFFALLLMIASMAFFLVQSKLIGGAPSVFGYQMYVVLSGSMNPAFDTGSLVFVKPLDPQNIEQGDIITYSSSGGAEVLTTHRVVDVIRDGELKFVTRGDANNVNDPNPVLAPNVVGKVHGFVPYLGYLIGYAQTRNGLIALVFVPGLLVIIFELRNIIKYISAMEKEKVDKNRRKNETAATGTS